MPTVDAPTTSEWLVILLHTKVQLIWEVWWYIVITFQSGYNFPLSWQHTYGELHKTMIWLDYFKVNKGKKYLDQVTKVWLFCYLLLLSVDSKIR